MINFIICEDEEVLANEYTLEIDKFMMRYDNDYKCYIYNGYTEAWKKTAQADLGFKVFILDLKTSTGSGLNAARLIREVYDDWSSMIIIITSYTEYRYDALEKRLLLVDFISKVEDYHKKLREDLLICMKNYNSKQKSLKYHYKSNYMNLEYRYITYIEKEKDSKKSKIHTTHGEYVYPGTLTELLKILDGRFIRCHRSALVNTHQITRFDPATNRIYFNNGEHMDLVSRDLKKEMLKYVRNN